MSPNKLTDTVCECKYHLVWIPKYRRKVVFGRLRVEIGKILRRLCEYKGVEIIEANACRDHIHMCVSIPPKYAVASIVGYLKGKSAIEVFEKFSKLRRNFRGHHFWARGYYVSTVGLDEAKVRNYIKNQEDSDRQSDQGEAPHLDPFE